MQSSKRWNAKQQHTFFYLFLCVSVPKFLSISLSCSKTLAQSALLDVVVNYESHIEINETVAPSFRTVISIYQSDSELNRAPNLKFDVIASPWFQRLHASIYESKSHNYLCIPFFTLSYSISLWQTLFILRKI